MRCAVNGRGIMTCLPMTKPTPSVGHSRQHSSRKRTPRNESCGPKRRKIPEIWGILRVMVEFELRVAGGPMCNSSRREIVLGAILVAAAFAITPSSLLAAEPAPLAIKGFDPVAYFTLGKPVPGRTDIAYEWDEYRYNFSSAEHREMFKSDPVRYAPQFPNFCALALTRGVTF